MKSPLKMQEKMGNAWVLVSRNVWPPHTPPCTATIDGKDPLNSAFLDGVLHHIHAVCCSANHPPQTGGPISRESGAAFSERGAYDTGGAAPPQRASGEPGGGVGLTPHCAPTGRPGS
jgi:hypothetical protein